MEDAMRSRLRAQWVTVAGVACLGVFPLSAVAQDVTMPEGQPPVLSGLDGNLIPAGIEPPLLPSGPPYTFVIAGTERGRLTGVLKPDPGGSLAAARWGLRSEFFLCGDFTADFGTQLTGLHLSLTLGLHWYPVWGTEIFFGWDLIDERFVFLGKLSF
jgi:hypothetical protein